MSPAGNWQELLDELLFCNEVSNLLGFKKLLLLYVQIDLSPITVF